VVFSSSAAAAETCPVPVIRCKNAAISWRNSLRKSTDPPVLWPSRVQLEIQLDRQGRIERGYFGRLCQHGKASSIRLSPLNGSWPVAYSKSSTPVL